MLDNFKEQHCHDEMPSTIIVFSEKVLMRCVPELNTSFSLSHHSPCADPPWLPCTALMQDAPNYNTNMYHLLKLVPSDVLTTRRGKLD